MLEIRVGEGTYSDVHKVQRISDGQIYALKRVKLFALQSVEQRNALNEVRILSQVESSHIIAFKQAFFEDHTL